MGKKTTLQQPLSLRRDGFEFSEGDKPKQILSVADHVRRLAYKTHEAGVKEWLRGLLTRIPGFPTLEQAKKRVTEALKKNPKLVSDTLDYVIQALKESALFGLPVTGEDARQRHANRHQEGRSQFFDFEEKNLMDFIIDLGSRPLAIAIIAIVMSGTFLATIIENEKQTQYWNATNPWSYQVHETPLLDKVEQVEKLWHDVWNKKRT